MSGADDHPFEWAILTLKGGLPVRRRSWPIGEYIGSVAPLVLQFRPPVYSVVDWSVDFPKQPPDVMRVPEPVRFVGYVKVDQLQRTAAPWAASYDEMIAGDWTVAYIAG